MSNDQLGVHLAVLSGDFTAPVLLTSSPADDTPNVAVTSSIVAWDKGM